MFYAETRHAANEANRPTGHQAVRRSRHQKESVDPVSAADRAGRRSTCRWQPQASGDDDGGDRMRPEGRVVTSSSILARPGRTSAGRPSASARSRTHCAIAPGCDSLVTWGPNERELADAVARARQAAPRRRRRRRRVSDLAVLMRDAALVVSGDTGPLHIAAAMGTPLVGLYGPTLARTQRPVGSARRGDLARGTCASAITSGTACAARRASTRSPSRRWSPRLNAVFAPAAHDPAFAKAMTQAAGALARLPRLRLRRDRRVAGDADASIVTDRRRDRDRRRIDPGLGRGPSREEQRGHAVRPVPLHASSAVSRARR